MRTKASFILLSLLLASACANPLAKFILGADDIFEPLIHSDTDEAAEQAYRLRLRDVYGYELRNTNKPHAILAELGKLRSDQISHRFVEDEAEYVLGVVTQAFITLKHKLTNAKEIAQTFTGLAQNYNARRLQQAVSAIQLLEADKKKKKAALVSAIDETVGPVINENVIIQAFDAFLKKQSIKDSKPDGERGYANLGANDLEKVDRDFVLEAAIQAFNSKIAEGRKLSATILAFRQAPLQQAAEAFTAVMGFLLHQTLSSEDAILLASRVANFVHLADLVADANAASRYIGQLGEVITQDGFAQMAKNPDFVQQLIIKVLKTAAMSPNLEGKRQAKKILVSYFVKLDEYEAPSQAYVEFIRRKYSKSGLKTWAAQERAEYKRMLRIYAIDILRTSLAADADFLKVSELNELFLGFKDLFEDHDPRQQKAFLVLRKMLLKAGPVVHKFPLLFESLYDSFLHASQYYTSKHPNADVDFAAFYNAYLDEMWSWKNGWLTSWLQWEPSPEAFPINVLENYAFFKLINLTTNFASFAASPVAFHDFKYQNNYPIHKYSTEEAPRQFLNFLRLRYFAQNSFNYAHLRKLQISKEVMGQYATYANVDRAD